ncbi:DNA polymerase III, alpha subunit [Leptospira inadai serovar Lyme str. 10]|uniref:DNA polymerase III subunit alpha n=3 Tax=Leptospira inadai TaxID=29506 RepID=V6H8Z6_9LEPT|nr:DNA polymerase III, alpha subunit [Leptospira inadai serovar Lyme str. 10]PNV75944.1 DNA polymerase III subunit alpha [Leptospira inadai serovar Lyme]
MSLGMEDFAHLHLHTTYSMLDGAIRIKELMKHVKELGMSSVAMTDHGNMFGAIEFYNEAVKNGVKPIIGCEFYVSPNRKAEMEEMRIADGNAYHLILLAKDEIGYKNLIKLASKSYTEGFYKKARIDYDLLDKHSEGLVCLTACLAGEVNRKILEGKIPESFQLAGKLNEIFRKEDFYLEIQNHGIPEQEIAAKGAYDFSQRTGIKLVVTNDSHFLRKDDKEAQDILLRIGMRKTIEDEMEFGFNQHFYVKSPAEMKLLFPELPQAYYSTLEIRDKINLQLKFGNYLLPEFSVPDGYDEYGFMEKLVWDGIRHRYSSITPEIKERTEFELGTIKNMRFAGYFLIVQDYINYAKRSGIPVGPGRGSAAGSIVAYALGITNVEPLRFNLLFERFLNPDRKDMPDIDTDFCVERREEVINYIRHKYGEDRVGQIITFGSLAAKAALKDVGRVMNLPYDEANRLTSYCPNKPGITLDEAIEISSDLKQASEKDELHKKIFSIAKRLEGNYRQPGRHAAGVVISPYPLDEVVPLSTVAEKERPGVRSIVTQYEKNNLEAVGLIKMDILGLKNLTTLNYAVKLVKERRGVELDLDKIPLDDSNTYALLRKANTLGIFQLESSGITDLVARSQVSSFEEIVALIALYRPGPMESGMLEEYLERKSGRKPVSYPHESCEAILKETFGLTVYQEQVMSISRLVGGFTMGESDMLRKAMAKKKKELMDPLRIKFIEGAQAKGHAKKFSEELFDQLEKFGGYGFNKSHSVAYALVTYQTAYMKANYPTEYMAALLAGDHSKTTDIVKYINNAREMGIHVLTPDLNESDVSFSVIDEETIRFGISAMKGVGEGAAENIIQARKKTGGFKDIKDFILEVDTRILNKKIMEALVQGGAMDSFGYTRKCLFESLDSLVSYAQKEQERSAQGQFSLFGESTLSYELKLPKDADEWESEERLRREKSVTGLFLSGHPLDRYEAHLLSLHSIPIEKLDDIKAGAKVEIAGIVTSLKVKFTKKKEEFVNFKLEDRTGEIECVAFPKVYQKFKELIKEDEAVFIKGDLDRIEAGESELRGQIKVNNFEILNQTTIEDKMEKALHIRLEDRHRKMPDIIGKLHTLLAAYQGNSHVYFHLISGAEEKKVIRAHNHYSVQPNDELMSRLVGLLGKETVYYSFGENVKAYSPKETAGIKR